MLLSVHKKSSRLAVLGELGRNPILLNALKNMLKYEWHLENISPRNSLVRHAYSEMDLFSKSGSDCWLSKVRKIKASLGISLSAVKGSFGASAAIKKSLNSKFSRFWMDSVQEVKVGQDGLDTNKLRLYKSFKGSFHTEPYLTLVKNRNQRSSLSMIQISAHHLEIERGRWVGVPNNQRYCKYCKFCGSTNKLVDDEKHFMLSCPLFP